MSANPYLYWQQELEIPGCNERDTNRRDLCGFYRIRGAETKPDWPLAIWLADMKLTAQVGRKQFAEGAPEWDDMLSSSWYKAEAVKETDYRAAVDSGRWPDGRFARHVEKAEAAGVETGAVTGMGHNLLEGDEHASLKIEVEDEKEQAEAFLKSPITTQEQADRAAAWAKKLTAIANKADGIRKVEKQPHIDAGKAVDDHWREIVETGKDYSQRLKRHLDAWLREQDRLEKERQRKAAEEAAHKQREAEEAAKAAQSGDDEDAKRKAEEAAAAAKQAEQDAQARNSQAGRTGAKVALRTFVSANITDYDKLLIALKDRDEIKTLVQSLANRAAKAGVQLDGMEITEERRAA